MSLSIRALGSAAFPKKGEQDSGDVGSVVFLVNWDQVALGGDKCLIEETTM